MSDKETVVSVSEAGKGNYIQQVQTATHVLTADEPPDMGGQDQGPAPYDFLLAALGSCTSMTVRMYADNKKWPLENVSIRLTHRKVAQADGKKTDLITRDITLRGALDDAQKQRLLEIANKCPVHRTLEAAPRIETKLAP